MGAPPEPIGDNELKPIVNRWVVAVTASGFPPVKGRLAHRGQRQRPDFNAKGINHENDCPRRIQQGTQVSVYVLGRHPANPPGQEQCFVVQILVVMVADQFLETAMSRLNCIPSNEILFTAS